MHGGQSLLGKPGRNDLAALNADLEIATQESLRRRGPEANENLRFDQLDFFLQPRQTGSDFASRRLLVHPPLAFRFPFEMLDDIGDISVGSIDAGRCQSFIKNAASGTDKRLSF